MNRTNAAGRRPRTVVDDTARRRLRVVLGFAAAALVVICYANGLAGPFVYDDQITVLRNPSLVDLSNTRFVAVYSLYRPFVNATYALDRMVWGYVPIGFHLTNVALHVVVVLLFYRLCTRWLGDAPIGTAVPVEWPSFFAAAVYAVHPMMTEGVEYISGRSEVLCAVGFLGALLFTRDAVLTGSRAARIAGIACGVLAFGSKETAAALPVVLLASDAWVFGRGSWKRRIATLHLPLFAVLALGVAARVHTMIRFEPLLNRTVHDNLLTQLIVVWRYLALLAVPAGQTIMHTVRFTTSLVEPASWFSLCAIVAAAGWALLERDRHPVVAVGIVWFLAALAPSSIIPLREGMAEHRVYLASGGMFLLAASLLARVLATSKAARIAAAAVVVVLAWLTVQRNVVWSDPRRIWAEAVRHSPTMWEPHFAYADALRDKGQCADAVPQYEAVLRLAAHQRDTLTNLGICYAELRRFDDSERVFTQLTTTYPDWSRGYTNFGSMEALRGRSDRARALYLEAINRDPRSVAARLLLAQMEEMAYHDYRAAALLCDESKAIDPASGPARECSDRNWRKVADGK